MDFHQETDAAQVDPHNGNFGLSTEGTGAQHRAVSAERHNQVRIDVERVDITDLTQPITLARNAFPLQVFHNVCSETSRVLHITMPEQGDLPDLFRGLHRRHYTPPALLRMTDRPITAKSAPPRRIALRRGSAFGSFVVR